MSQPVVFKEDSEKRTYGWDYDPETVSSAVITISPAGLDKDGGEIIDGSQVSQKIKNGIGGENYRMVFEVNTNEGNTYIDVIFVSIYSI